jgi:hypothetical protein
MTKGVYKKTKLKKKNLITTNHILLYSSFQNSQLRILSLPRRFL